MARRLIASGWSRYLCWTWPLAIAFLLLAGSSGCQRESQQAVPPAAQAPSPASSPVPPLPVQTKGREIRSDRERNDSPRASTRDLKALAQGSNAFALDLYRKLSNGEGNLFFSPFSVSQVLAMAFAGARGETERQMANTLHYDLPQSALHPSFNALDRELASRGRGLQGEENQFFQLNIANAIWGQQGYEFLPDFLDVLAETTARVYAPWTSRAPRRNPGQ